MTNLSPKTLRLTLLGVVGLALVTVSILTVPLVKGWIRPASSDTHPGSKGSKLDIAELIRSTKAGEPLPLTGEETTLRLPTEVVRSLGIKTAQTQPATPLEPLKLSGSLFLDASRLARVHTRFPGEVVEISRIAAADPTQDESTRPLRFGDKVKAGQLLAVVWS